MGCRLWGRTESDTTEVDLAAVAVAACVDVRVGLSRKLSTEELMLLNCGVGEDS